MYQLAEISAEIRMNAKLETHTVDRRHLEKKLTQKAICKTTIQLSKIFLIE